MSDQVPTKAYVYQPWPAKGFPRCFGVAGPGAERFANDRFTKEDAQAVANAINSGKTTAAMLKALGNTPEAKAAVGRHGGR